MAMLSAFHERHTEAFSWATPINTTRPWPPSRAVASSKKGRNPEAMPNARGSYGTPQRELVYSVV